MNKLLVVVDYQNDFVSGSLGFEDAVKIDENIAEKVRKYRAEGADIIYTMDTHTEEYFETQEGKKLPVLHCINGTEGWKLFGKTGAECKDAMTLGKSTFGSLDLVSIAEARDYDEIELCGVVTNICVIANAVLLKTAQPEAEIIIDAKCTASNDRKLYEETLDVLESMQFTIINR